MEIHKTDMGPKVVADVLDIVGGKWRGLILIRLCNKPMRFNELKTDLKKITSSTLTKELRYLEEIKIVQRKTISALPSIVEYSLTPHGKSIEDLVYKIIDWGLKHRKVVLSDGHSVSN